MTAVDVLPTTLPTGTRGSFCGLLLLHLAFAAPHPAAAQTLAPPLERVEPDSTPAATSGLPLWELGAGLAGLHVPHYRGAAQAYSGVLPVPFGVYRGDILRADRDGARAVLFDSDNIDIDVSLFATVPVSSSDDAARSGMPDLRATIEIGPNLQFTLLREGPWLLQLRLPVRTAITLQSRPQQVGWVATPNLNLDWHPGHWNVGMQLGPVFGTRDFFGYFYDVSATEATAVRPAYQSAGGFGGWQATLSMSRRFGSQWFGLFVRADSVAGAVFVDSPLVSRHETLAAGFAWSWSWLQSTQRVADRQR
ncbi:MAG: MipA/OmpV family protein [Rubrivivax sp.]